MLNKFRFTVTVTKTNDVGAIKETFDLLGTDSTTTTTYQDKPFELKNKSVYYNNIILYKDTPITLDDGSIMTMTLIPTPPKAKIGHWDVCRNCKFWSNEEGARKMYQVTHKYAGGASFSRFQEIQTYQAEQVEGIPLTKRTVGYCPKEGGQLIAGNIQKCLHYKPKTSIVKLINLIKGVF